jgi:hypothetical protein
MQNNIFSAGGTQDRISSRTDTRNIEREITRLEAQRRNCFTAQEYRALSDRISKLLSDVYYLLENQGQLNLES